MGTTLIESKKNGYDPDKLSDQQRAFVLELLASDQFCATEAARKAGYKHPAQMSNKLLKRPNIQAALGKAQREREERLELKSDDVWKFLATALMINPFDFFRPTKDGYWLIDNLDDLPDEIGRLIDQVKVVRMERNGIVKEQFEVKLIDKAVCLALAMKHGKPIEHSVTHSFDWDALYQRDEQPVNTIDARLADESR